MTDSLPYSQAAENNREPILAVLRRLLADVESVLEIGSGTGQHAVAFSAALPHLFWQPTEHPAALPMLKPRCEASSHDNLGAPLPLDILDWPETFAWPQALYTANTLHIVGTDTVRALFDTCAVRGQPGTRLLVYGPFNYQGRYTSESNAQFDVWLKQRDPASGIRDFEWVDTLAEQAGYALLDDVAMPANNRLLCWEKRLRDADGRQQGL